MKKESKKLLITALSLFLAFLLWTFAVISIDVRNIGPMESSVGLSGVNGFFHNLTGTNMFLYKITDLLSIIPFGIMAVFAVFGFLQLVKRKSIKKVDYNILVLGGFYAVLMGIYFFFELFPVNYRPVLIDGILEASYPSSTTMLVLSVIPTAIMQFDFIIKNPVLKKILSVFMSIFAVFMLIGRTFSGVHWISDIIGGILISFFLVSFYRFIVKIKE